MYHGSAGGNGDWRMDGRMAKDRMGGLVRRKQDGKGMSKDGARMAFLSTLMLCDSIICMGAWCMVSRFTQHWITFVPRSALFSENVDTSDV